MTLVEALRMFNRKERYWLIRNALGEDSKKLDPTFRNSLNGVLPIEERENVWWAMDYHLDWLVGALHLFSNGEGTAYKRQYYRTSELVEGPQEELVKGNQEDVDFIIASSNTLIFIEAKGDAAGWDYQQLNRKIHRLQNIEEKYFNGVEPFFFLMAPKALQNKFNMDKITSPSPNWIFDGDKLRWLDLQIKNELETNFEDFHRVGRCNEDDDPCKTGKFFLVKNPKSSNKNNGRVAKVQGR